jgi:hypothetical protein
VSLTISQSVIVNKWEIKRNGVPPISLTTGEAVLAPEDIYRLLSYNYPKFFKMDILCKWAWLAAEYLLSYHNSVLRDGLDKTKVAVVLMTSHGCLEVDKKYNETLKTLPSPALFVYTLPNIMLGEISIRHGFKGEQACLVNETFDSGELHFWVNDLLEKRDMEACLCGWADVTEHNTDIALFWVEKQSEELNFSAANLEEIYKKNKE